MLPTYHLDMTTVHDQAIRLSEGSAAVVAVALYSSGYWLMDLIATQQFAVPEVGLEPTAVSDSVPSAVDFLAVIVSSVAQEFVLHLDDAAVRQPLQLQRSKYSTAAVVAAAVVAVAAHSMSKTIPKAVRVVHSGPFAVFAVETE